MTAERHWTRTTLPLLESVPDAVVVVDPAGTIVYANRLVEPMFGYRAGDVVGRPVEMLVPEQVRAQHRRHRRAYEQARSTRPMLTGADLRGLHESGREFSARHQSQSDCIR